MELKWLWVVMLVFLFGNCFECDACWEEEKLALIQLKPFFSHIEDVDDWPASAEEGARSTSDCCQWKRVECNTVTRRVTTLLLNLTVRYTDDDLVEYRYKLSGGNDYRYLNGSLFLPFVELNNLYLSGNQFAGCVPDEGIERLLLSLDKLKILDLGDNHFNESILLSLSELSSLKSLYLGYNNFTNSNLAEGIKMLSKGLNKLKTLDLSGNILGNDILTHLGSFTSLKYLYLTKYGLEGIVRMQEFNNLMNLKELHLGHNEIQSFEFLQGTEGTFRLLNLEVLGLSYNLLNNSVLPSLAAFSNLKSLYLRGNKFNGVIDIKELNDLCNLEELQIGCLSHYDPRDFASTNCSIILRFGLFPSMKSLYLEGFGFNGTTTTQEWQNLINLEELVINNSFLSSNFIRGIETLASLKFLSISMSSDFSRMVNSSLLIKGPLYLKNLEYIYVKGISLENNFLDAVGAMPSLKSLHYIRNGLSGSLPTQSFCGLKHLEVLHIGKNNVKGHLPDCFSNLTSLKHLILSSNQFSGNISCLISLTSLEYLDLSSNQFSGNIYHLNSLTSLKELRLSNNNFEIPSSLAPFYNLSRLKRIYADNNTIYAETEIHSLSPRFQLTDISISCCGSFPKFLYHQHDLEYVDLSNILFKGEFPIWLLENNTKLYFLKLVNNSLFGPFQLPFYSNLAFLDVSNNFLNGRIPKETGVHLPLLQLLNMSNNQFNGSIPSSFGDMSWVEVLDLSNNQFSGSIADSLSNNLLLETLEVSNNQLSGEIPKWIGNLQYLEEIVMANNSLQGPIPEEFCNLNQLKFLDLSMNNISGTLPPCFNPSRINQVYLSNNNLQGSLPVVFRNSSLLLTLDLSYNHFTGNIPNWISRLSKLSYLLLTRNHFEGEIPIELCKLTHLSLIDLSHNNLSGHIPHCLKISAMNHLSPQYFCPIFVGGVNNPIIIEKPIKYTIKGRSYSYKGKILGYLSGIDLSCNKLTGEIPQETENFRMVNALNFSHNSLTGSIPQALSNLRQIESLDLSFNNLSGNIPPKLVELNFLVSFNVSYNNLSGRTPEMFQQFSTFDESSYLRNPFLCGAPLQKNCSTTQTSSPIPTVDNGWIDMSIFYVSFIICYIVVVLAIVLVLYINPYWRQAWFYHVERAATSCYYFVVDHLPGGF